MTASAANTGRLDGTYFVDQVVRHETVYREATQEQTKETEHGVFDVRSPVGTVVNETWMTILPLLFLRGRQYGIQPLHS
jgi:uncharacterized protein (UPF0218 family)